MTEPIIKSRYGGITATNIVRDVGVAVHQSLIDRGCGDIARACYLVPGSIAFDDCEPGCGQLAQTITEVAPSLNPPAPAVDTRQTPCGPGQVVVRVTLIITRCVPGVDDNGNAPSCAELDDAAICLESDRAAARRGVACYLASLRRSYTVMDFGVNAATSVGPEGGCAGVQLTCWFAVSDECC